MSIFKKKREEILAPTGSYHQMDELMTKDNPSHPYSKNFGDHVPKEVSAKFPLWKSILYIVFLPLSYFRK